MKQMCNTLITVTDEIDQELDSKGRNRSVHRCEHRWLSKRSMMVINDQPSWNRWQASTARDWRD